MLYLVSCFLSLCLSLFYAYVLALFRRVYNKHYKATDFSDLDIRILEKTEKKEEKR